MYKLIIEEIIIEKYKRKIDTRQYIKYFREDVVFNATYISVMSWRSVLLVEETGNPGENYPSATSS